MSDIAIRVAGLSKRYRIGAKQRKYKTLRDSLTEGVLRPFRAVRSLARPNGDATCSSGSQSNISNSKFDSIWALKDVSFEVKHGEVMGIIGRNGAGKSTLLKILSRITEPTEGYADINGRVASLLEVGTGFHPELTGRENIYLNGSILGMKRTEIQSKFDEIVAFAEIERFLDTPVKHYSSGMYVRLAFAVAAHLEPEILIVDEVLAVGDLAFQKKCMGKMGNVAKEGRTVLFVSHNMAAIEALCSRGCLLVNGKIDALGRTGEIVGRYFDSIKKTSLQDLRTRKDRTGNGRLVFTAVTLENGDGTPVEVLAPGKDTSIVLSYEGSETLKNVSLSIGFYGLHGQFLLLCNNEMAGQPFESLPPSGQIRCMIPRLPFSPGNYNLNLYCEVNGSLADWVQEACLITVVEGDYYGTGKTTPASHGGFLVPQSWDFKQNGDGIR